MALPQLFETNPVLAVEGLVEGLRADPCRWAASGPILDAAIGRLSMTGHGVPLSVLQRWGDAGLISPSVLGTASRAWCPGVVGLVHGEPGGCVVPLDVSRGKAWQIARQLPLESGRLLDLLLRLVEEASLLEPGALPEARAFAIDTPFPLTSVGPSMDVAAALAILHCEAGDLPVMERACALVELDGSTLRAVGGVERKLQAFVRECGTGTLLVRHAECRASAAFEASFDEVWSVSSIADLARHLSPLGIFEPWLLAAEQGLVEADLVLGRLRDLQHPEPDHEAVVQLAGRALECSWRDEVPMAIRHRPRLDLLRSLRHLGRYEEALQAGERWRQEIRDLGEATSREMIAEADLEFAAALFDPADFGAMLEVLDPWLRRIDEDPLSLSSGLRIRLWNTAARAMVRIEREGWHDLFERSLDLQAKTDPAGLPRTRNYLIEGLLRSDRLEDVEQQIGLGELSGPDATSRAMLVFYRADLARRRGSCWTDEVMDGQRPDARRANHPLGLYLQATARQPGRNSADASDRFRRARECFAFDADRSGEANVLWVLAHCMALAVEVHDDASPIAASEVLTHALAQPGLEALRARLGALPTKLDESESFLCRLQWT